jgi:hypothetical protein
LKATFKNETGIVSGLSGMTCALPAWHVMEVLKMKEFADMRAKKDEKQKKEKLKGPIPEKVEAQPAIPDGDRRLFKRLIAEAVKRPKSSG